MAKWDQWLKNDTNKKEKFNSKYNDDFNDRPLRDKKRRKPRSGRPTHEDYPFD